MDSEEVRPATEKERPPIRAFLQARFRPNHLVEFRAIRSGCVRRFWATPASMGAIERTLRRLDFEGWDIYAGVNPRGGQSSNEQAVRELVAFHVDLDNPLLSREVRPDSKCSALEKPLTEKQKPVPAPASPHPRGSFLCEWFFESGAFASRSLPSDVPPPSVIVSSGRGLHLYWVLESPVRVTDENRERLKSINRGLALAVGGDGACGDLSRILRLPGLTNHKPPASEVRLLSSDGPRYPLSAFDSFIKPALNALPTATISPTTAAEANPLTPGLGQRFKCVRRENPEIQRAWRGEIGDGSSDSRFILVKRLIERDFPPEEILAIVCSRRWYNRRSKRVRPPVAVLRDTSLLLAKLTPRVGHVG